MSLPDFQVLKDIQLPDKSIGLDHDIYPSVVAFSDDEQLMAVSIGTAIYICDTKSFELKRAFDGKLCTGALFFLKNSNKLFAASTGTTRAAPKLLLDVTTGEMTGHFIRIFDVANAEVWQDLECGFDTVFALSPDKTKLVLSENYNNSFQVWDLAGTRTECKYKKKFIGGRLNISKMIFLDNDNILATQGEFFHVIRLKNDPLSSRYTNKFKQILLCTLHEILISHRDYHALDHGAKNEVLSLDYDANEHRLLAIYSNKACIYSTITGEEIVRFVDIRKQRSALQELSYSPDSRGVLHKAISIICNNFYEGENFHSNLVWPIPVLTLAFKEGRLSIQQILFIIVAHAYKEQYPNVNAAFNALPYEIKNELIEVFLSFTETQQQFLKTFFFS